jgi:hypothetical protein
VKTSVKADPTLDFLTHGFIPAKEISENNRLFASVSARWKCGKTRFGLTAPLPIGYIDVDLGVGELLTQTGDKAAQIHVLSVTPYETQEASREMLDRLKEAIAFLCDSQAVRSIVIDTATELWEMVRFAHFGRLSSVMPRYYEAPNNEMAFILDRLLCSRKNVVLLHRMKDKYVNDKATGEDIPAMFKETAYVTNVNCRLYRDDPGDEGVGEFHLVIDDCRANASVQGLELTGDSIGFPLVAQMIYPDTDPAVWE